MKYLLIIMLIYLGFCLDVYSASQMYESDYEGLLVVSKMLIHDIDEDGNQDTVIGRYCSENMKLPFFVKWGVDSVQSNTNDSLLPRYTTFQYPNYKYNYLTCVPNIYSGDTISNFLIMTEGEYSYSINNVYYRKDSSNCYIIYFTPELRRIDKIKLDTIKTSMMNPYRILVINNNSSSFDSNTVIVIPYLRKNNVLAKTAIPYEPELTETEQTSTDFTIKLFPNPCSNQIYYEFNSVDVGEYQVRLYDNNGNIVYREDISNTIKNNNYTKEIAIKYSLASGNYCFVVMYQEKTIFKQNVIIRN